MVKFLSWVTSQLEISCFIFLICVATLNEQLRAKSLLIYCRCVNSRMKSVQKCPTLPEITQSVCYLLSHLPESNCPTQYNAFM